MFIVEATLVTATEDDPSRGHLTYVEALDMGARAGAKQTVLVHYRPQNRDTIIAACAGRSDATAGHPGLVVEIAAARSTVDVIDGTGQLSDVGMIDADGGAGTASRAARAR